MTITAPFRAASVAALLSLALAGCASTAAPDHSTRGAPMAGSGGMQGQQGMQGMAMDMQAMCDMHKKQMAGKSPQERQAMMDEHMRSMTPEMRSRMQTMMQQCR